jgi:hypothetical protein
VTGWRGRALAMAAIVVVLGGLTIALGERIGINAGQGWDGQDYLRWSGDFWHRVVELGVTRYQAQRVLPSAIVYAVLHGLHVSPTVEHHVVGFALLDLALLAGAAALWAHLAHAMSWRRAATWVGFVALFGGFANARHALYDPVLTDSTAFALGMGMTWAYLTRRPAFVALAGALGCITWPALPPIACVLLVLRRPAAPVAPARVSMRWPAAGLAIVAALAFILLALHYQRAPLAELGMAKFAAWVRTDLFALTLPLLAALLAAGWYLLAREPRLWQVRGYVQTLTVRHVVAALCAVAAMLAARAWWLAQAGTQGPGPGGATFAYEHTQEALRGPLWGPVHHFVYFGPIVGIAMLAWRRIAALAAEWGPGVVVALAFVVAFAAGSESRQWIHLLPLLVAITIAATDDRWTARRAAGFTLLALAWSKLWFYIGYAEPGDWHAFPDQRYFMHHGPFATDAMYLVHLVAAALTIAVLALLVRRPRALPAG